MEKAMKINFNEMEAKVNNRFKDGEGDFIAKIKSDDLNKIIYGTLTPGSSIGYHKHETNSEIIYITTWTNGSEPGPEGAGAHGCGPERHRY